MINDIICDNSDSELDRLFIEEVLREMHVSFAKRYLEKYLEKYPKMGLVKRERKPKEEKNSRPNYKLNLSVEYDREISLYRLHIEVTSDRGKKCSADFKAQRAARKIEEDRTTFRFYIIGEREEQEISFIKSDRIAFLSDFPFKDQEGARITVCFFTFEEFNKAFDNVNYVYDCLKYR